MYTKATANNSRLCLLSMFKKKNKKKTSSLCLLKLLGPGTSPFPIHSKSSPKRKKGEWEPCPPYKRALWNIAMETAGMHGCRSFQAHQLRLMKRLIPHMFNQNE